ncbi:hypothetical protein L6164_005379 [Bauhinia variegata]|uniref:Uncharacterized protein n=1 Tax=Bauhinia variegata TaxID=167791 RepID=A0ACB9PSJ9_BAUVA|nr:hypothetical protein L6164_005379 [Bauhinia variegata]
MGIWRKDMADEAKKQLWLAGPMISVSLFQCSLQLISVMFVGHLGELPLAATSLASSFANVSGFCVLAGMACALDTFCGQSYGAEQHHMLGIHMQRGMLVILIVTIPVAIIWVNLRLILVVLHQNHIIAKEAQAYARYLIPSLSANGILQCMIKFLQTQNIVIPMVLATGISCLLHVLFSWFLVLKFGLGNKGAAIAICLSSWISCIQLSLYIKFSSSCTRSWTGFLTQSFHGIPKFLRLAIPSALMFCLESWTFELVVLLSGVLPNPKLQTSVLSICLNTAGIFWMVPFGVSAAASTRVSDEVGAGRPKAAYLAVKVIFLMALTVGILGSMLLLIRNIWGHAFTNVTEVVSYVASLMPVLASMAFLDAIQTAMSGVARGCGWQKLGACVNLGSYYIIGVPSAVVFAFVLHMKGRAKKAETRVQGTAVPVDTLSGVQNVSPH